MNQPFCELCGERLATVSLAEAGACDDCAELEFQRVLAPVLGYRPCATITNHASQQQLCLAPAGLEHDHSGD